MTIEIERRKNQKRGDRIALFLIIAVIIICVGVMYLSITPGSFKSENQKRAEEIKTLQETMSPIEHQFVAELDGYVIYRLILDNRVCYMTLPVTHSRSAVDLTCPK